jgi:hypothetical protein
MNPLKSNRLAWSVAVAALALWATSAPISWGQVAFGSAHLFDQDQTQTPEDTARAIDTDISNTIADDTAAQTAPCATLPPAIAELVPPAIAQLVPTPVIPPVTSGQARTFHLCGPDAQVERAIEQLVAGRGFNSTLSARGDGCADLTVSPSGQAGSGSSTSNLSVSIGSGRTLSIKIVSEQGATHASITS